MHPKRQEDAPRAAVWDLDGTLVDSAPDLAAALGKLLSESGLSGPTVARTRNMIGGGVKRLVAQGFEAAGAPLAEDRLRSCSDRFMELYGACATEHTVPFPGIPELLDALSTQRFFHGICTNKPLALTRQIVRELGLDRHFHTVIGGDSTPEKKPHPLPLQTCLEEMGVNRSRAVMIGDSAADLGAARAVGIPVVLVTFGYSPEPVANLNPDALIDRFDELPKALSRLGLLP